MANWNWESVKENQNLTVYFLTDSTLSVVTDSSHCDGTYTVQLVNNFPFDRNFQVFATCITPADHMWWTFQCTLPVNGTLEAIPRLNPTAYLSNMTYRFKVSM